MRQVILGVVRQVSPLPGHTGLCRAVALLVGIVLPCPAFCQPIFQGLGDLPGGDFDSIAKDVSADGRVVVGMSIIFGDAADSLSLPRFEAFRWEDGVMVGLGDLPGGPFYSQAAAVSADGSVVVGLSLISEGGGSEAFQWRDGAMTGLGQLTPGEVYSRAEGVSADGSVIVGYGVSDSVISAFRYFKGAFDILDDLPGGGSTTIAYDVTPDGQIVLGTCSPSSGGSEVCRWVGIVPEALGVLPGGLWGYAYAVTPDGSVIVGSSGSTEGHQAFRWEDGVMVGLGDLPDRSYPGFDTDAEDVSADRSVIVGYNGAGRAIIWTRTGGIHDLQHLLTTLYGVDLTGWSLERAYGVSANGRTIVGYGTNPSGDREAWIVRLPPTPTIPAVGGVGLALLIVLLAGAGVAVASMRAKRAVA